MAKVEKRYFTPEFKREAVALARDRRTDARVVLKRRCAGLLRTTPLLVTLELGASLVGFS